MTPQRPTPERLEEIRANCERVSYQNDFVLKQLLVEIAALRADCKCISKMYLTRKNQACDLAEKLEDIIDDRDKWKWEYENVSKFATDYEQQRDKLKNELESQREYGMLLTQKWLAAEKELDALKSELARAPYFIKCKMCNSEYANESGLEIQIQNENLKTAISQAHDQYLEASRSLGVLKAESEKLKFDTEFLRNCHIAKDLMCACTRNKFRDLEKENQALRERIARLREALTTIASQHRPRHATEEYWNKVSHEQCATVLATDTKIAREALAQDDKVDVK